MSLWAGQINCYIDRAEGWETTECKLTLLSVEDSELHPQDLRPSLGLAMPSVKRAPAPLLSGLKGPDSIPKNSSTFNTKFMRAFLNGLVLK